MQFLVLFLAILVETLVFAQMPIFTVIPALTAGTMIHLSSRLTSGSVLLYSLSVGLIYDLIRESGSSLLYFYSFGGLGLLIIFWRTQIASQSSERRGNSYYLSLVAAASLVTVSVPAIGVIDRIGYQAVLYTIIIQFIFLGVFLFVLRSAGQKNA